MPKKERFSDPRFYVAIAAMIALFGKSLFDKPERQIDIEKLPENFAGLEISAFQAFLAALVVLVLATLFVHVVTSEKRAIDNI